MKSLTGLMISLADTRRRAVGAAGELFVKALLERHGYIVKPTDHNSCQGDLIAIDSRTGEIWKIEVKTSRKNKDGKWRFKLYKAGHTDHKNADIVFLVAVMPSGRCVCFVVPVEILANQRQAVITSHPDQYAGKLSVFRQPFNAINLGI
jgi:Holliday junction resolvase-like predicted endonuclease